MNAFWTLLLAGALAAIPPLDEGQRERLVTASDGSPTVDEAGFYALLENARQWQPGQVAGATVPDYAAIGQEPADHRGELFLIEGRLQTQLPTRRWSRSGWEQVRGLVIRVDDGEDDATAEQMVIVHLVDPPQLTPTQHEQLYAEFDTPVRLAARFHKTVTYERREDGAPREYLAFVGRDLAWMGEPPGRGTGEAMLNPLTMIVLGGLGIAALIFVIWRARELGRSTRHPRQTAEYLDDKRSRRAAKHAGGQAEHVQMADDDHDEIVLPEDPASALDELTRRHREQ